jgi:stress response protein YsnF
MAISVGVPESEVAHASAVLKASLQLRMSKRSRRNLPPSRLRAISRLPSQVGKEMAETGRTRVRRFVTEREAAQDVTLHEEHAEVPRKAVSDPAFVGEIDWADGAIEIIETAEHALVNKTARVVEEVGLKKIGSYHVETIRDKLRRRQVEIERLGADGKVIRDPRTA